MQQVSARGAQRVVRVTRHGVPELIEAMDRGEIAISRASEIAGLPPDKQRDVLRERLAREAAPRRCRPRRRLKARKMTIPWSPTTASRLIATKWPPSLARELAEALLHRLEL